MKRNSDRPCKGCEIIIIKPRSNRKFCTPICKATFYNKIYRTDGRIPQRVGKKK